MVRTYAATEAITTSMGQNDAGLFELNFRDNRYLPFEFAGAVGRWRIELPPETNAFDFDSLSDVILHLNYTAREGGEELRRAAAEATRCRLPGDGQRLLDVRRDLPEAWAGLSRRTTGRQGLALDLSPAMFPLVPARRVTRVDWLRVFVEAPGAAPGAALDLTFLPPQGSRLAPCERVPVHCVADGAWPGLFVGEVDLTGLASLAELTEGRPTRIGTLEFPVDPLRICDAFLLIGYGTQPRSRPPVP